MRTYRLTSSEMIHTPGILRWAINGYKFPKDRPQILAVFTEGFQGENAPSAEEFDALLSGRIPYREEEGTIIFDVYDWMLKGEK